MKKIKLLGMVMAMVLTLSACGSAGGNTNTATQENQQTAAAPDASESTDSTEVVDNETSTMEDNTSRSNVLVAVFSRIGENYQVGVIEKGNTMIVAEMVQEGTGADLFEIKPETPYPDAAVMDGFTVSGQTAQGNPDNAKETVDEWLEKWSGN